MDDDDMADYKLRDDNYPEDEEKKTVTHKIGNKFL